MLPRELRHRLKVAVAPLRVTIPQGPLQGFKWSLATGLSFVRGTYEPRTAEALTTLTSPGAVVYDVGAHVGYFTAVAARAAGPEGRVVAFEPRPLNRTLLDLHLKWNGLERVQVVPSAVGAEAGPGRFRDDRGSGTGFLTAEDRGMEVEVVTLDGMVDDGLPAPDVVKVDVEGGEAAVLQGASGILETRRPVLVLATHGQGPHAASLRTLDEKGYQWRELLTRSDLPGAEIVAWPAEAPESPE